MRQLVDARHHAARCPKAEPDGERTVHLPLGDRPGLPVDLYPRQARLVVLGEPHLSDQEAHDPLAVRPFRGPGTPQPG
jgi:hypothetical protein